MAGMLPGVECARRRRLHQSSGCSDMASSAVNGSTRRPSFCLYTSNHESLLSSTSSMRSKLQQGHHDERLGEAAREAKERLDEKLRAQWKSDPKRGSNCQESRLRVEEGRCVVVRDLQTTEVCGSKKSSGGGNYSKRFGWGKWRWRASEQEECAICLECFKAGENLTHLPCAHRFHSRCLVPWLERSSHCPCCRGDSFQLK